MKKIATALTLVTLVLGNMAWAQSIENVKKMYIYERYKTAYTEANNIIKATPNNAEAYYWAVLSLIQSGKKADAATLAATALTATNNDPLATATAATLDLFNSKKEEAKAKFEAAYAAAGKKAKNSIILAIGRAHGSVGKSQADVPYAIAKVQEITNKETSNAEALTILGDVYRRLQEGGGSKAVPEYMNALRSNPSYALAAYRMGQVYQTQDNCKYLTENYNKAVAADGNFMPAWRELFEVYGNKESACYDLNQAKSFLDKYTATTDQGMETDKVKIQFYYFNNEPQKAIETINGLEKQYGATIDPSVYLYKALSYKDLKDSLSAKTTFDTYLAKQDPTKITYRQYNAAGDIAAKIVGKELDALPYYQKSIELLNDPKANLAFYKIAEVYEKAKDYKNAAIALKKIVDGSDNPLPSQFYKLGVNYYYAQDYANCATAFQAMEAKYPTDYRAPLWMGRANAALDTTYTGLGVAPFEKYIEMVKMDSTKHKSGLVDAYTYLTIFNANNNNKPKALEYLQKLKWIDASN